MPCIADPTELPPPAEDCVAPFHQFTGIYRTGNVATVSALQIPWAVLVWVVLFLCVTFLAGFRIWEWTFPAMLKGHASGNPPPCDNMQLDSNPPYAGLLHDMSHAFGRPSD